MPFSYVTLVLVLLVFGAIACALIILAMTIALLRPPRMSDGKAIWVLRRLSPGDLGLKFEDVHFNIRDEQTGKPLRIAGWWMAHPAAAGRCVVLLHGYADAKVGAIAWAPLWHSLGYNILAIDLRAHGESGGQYCTAGYWERHDVSQVIDQLRAERAADARQIVLFGVSLGAAVAAATAAMREDLRAVVLESIFTDFRTAGMTHLDRLGAPGRPFQSMTLLLAERMTHCDFSAVRPIDLVKQIPCPIMIISPNEDPLVSEADREAMTLALQSRNRGIEDVYWRVASGNQLAIFAEPREYERRLRDFVAVAGSVPFSGR
jgi:pimeloyl-ACP methyl ester carboxylesterase